MILQQSDICRIGTDVHKDEFDNLVIVCNVDTANIEEILLRCILKLFGDYYIISEEDFDDYIEFVTNLPYHYYEEICD